MLWAKCGPFAMQGLVFASRFYELYKRMISDACLITNYATIGLMGLSGAFGWHRSLPSIKMAVRAVDGGCKAEVGRGAGICTTDPEDCSSMPAKYSRKGCECS